jgi:membrane-associated phospholipid phosphatase
VKCLLLSRPARRLAWALAAACAVVVAVLGAAVAHQSQAGYLDAGIDASIKARLASHLGAAMTLVDLGDPAEATIICAVVVVACLALRRFRAALLMAVAVPLASAITELALKPAFGRTLGGEFSFPSGHETGVSAISVSLIVLLTGPTLRWLPAALRWVLAALVAATMASVAICLVAVGYHYFTDTIGGACVGTGTVMLTALAVDALFTRLARASRARPAPAEQARPAAAPESARAAE